MPRDQVDALTARLHDALQVVFDEANELRERVVHARLSCSCRAAAPRNVAPSAASSAMPGQRAAERGRGARATTM